MFIYAIIQCILTQLCLFLFLNDQTSQCKHLLYYQYNLILLNVKQFDKANLSLSIF